jgi:hypothetical protein
MHSSSFRLYRDLTISFLEETHWLVDRLSLEPVSVKAVTLL